MLKLILAGLIGATAFGQIAQPVANTSSDPVGACFFGQPMQWNGTSHNLWACGADSAWHHAAGVLSGTPNALYTLDVGSSGTSGTVRLWDQTPSTGSTLVLILGGAGQSGDLEQFRNNTGQILGGVDLAGDAFVSNPTNSNKETALGTTGIFLANPNELVFCSGASVNSCSADVSLQRSAAGLIEINNGTTGTYRDILLRTLYSPLLTPASSSAACTQNAFQYDANFLYVCTATNTWKRAALSTF